MTPTKRRKLSASEYSDIETSASSDEENSLNAESSDEAGSDAESLAIEDEIVQTNAKSQKTQKRKRRATSPSRFGSTLQALLNTDAPSNQLLALTLPSVAKRRTDEALENKARKLLEGEKKEREERNHIQDVIGSWETERERSLRKVAQRGVVKLFNAVQRTQAAATVAQEEVKAARGSGKPTLPKPALVPKTKKIPPSVGSSEKTLNKDAFLQMIKAGGVVSNA